MSTNTKIHDKLIKDYWIQKIIDNEHTYTISALHADKNSKIRKVKHLIDPEVQQIIKNIAGGNETMAFVIYLSFFSQLLDRYFNAEQLLIAAPSFSLSGDASATITNKGYLFFKLKNEKNYTVKQQLGKTKDEVLESLNYTGFNLEELQNHIINNGMDVQKSLFQFGCFYDGIHATAQDIPKVGLGLHIKQAEDAPVFEMKYNSSLFENKFIKQFLNHLHNLIKTSLSNLDTLQFDINFLSEQDEETLIHKYNKTSRKYPADKSIHQLFEQQVAKNPQASAINYGDEKLTYEELNVKANNLANYFIQQSGVKPGDFVALLFDRTIDWIVSLLAILKSGAAYVPLDRSYPRERLQLMLEDVQPKVLLLNSDDMFEFDYFGGEIFAMDIQMDGLEEHPENLKTTYTEGQEAYIIYTSGSTGKPKGVVVSHKNVVRLVKNTNFIKIKPEDRLLVTGAPVFDATTFEVWGMLLNGASLYLIEEEKLLNPDHLKATLLTNKITTIWLTASWFNQLIDHDITLFQALQHVVFGGEKASLKHVNKIHEAYPQLKLTNGYGPTENTTFSLCHQVDGIYNTTVPIGKPIANSTAYILDEKMRPQPFGVKGEIYVGGDGVALRYLNNPQLTKERFVSNPFGNGYLYKTGDIGVRQFNGTVLFADRNDKQIKIRGYRIEPEEIEKVLKQHPVISDVAVVPYKEADDTYSLVAYYIANEEVTPEDISSYCSEKLPKYMCPAYFMNIPAMPLTVNGKLNKKQLPKPGTNSQENESFVAPETPTEKRLAAIWEEVLDKDRISVLENFFKIGGHSLRATKVISRIHQELGVNADLKDLFLMPTIKELAQELDKADKKAYQNIVPLAEQELYEVSYAQHRLWVLDQFEESQVAYSMPLTYQLFQVNESAIEKAIHTVVERHESLRTTFVEKDGKVFQQIKSIDESGFQLVKIDVSTQPDAAKQAFTYIQEAIQTPFDLKNGPLVKAYLVHQANDTSTLLFNMHHIISDGWSIKVLLFEAITLYQAFVKGEENPLEPLRIQYKDYAAWQKQELSGNKITKHKEYWQNLLSGELPVLNLPLDYTRPAIKTYNGSTIGTTIDAKQTLALNTLARNNGASLFMTLLAGVKTLLYRYTSQDDIIIGSTIAGRDHKDLEDQIGFYVNTLAFRSQIEGNKSFENLLQKVKQHIVNAYEHQVYPFDKLVSDLDLVRDPGRSPIFDVMVNLLNIDGPSFKEDASQSNENAHKAEATHTNENNLNVSKFDLTFAFTEIGQELSCYIEYNTDLFAPETIERMLEHMQILFQQICTDSSQVVDEIQFISENERSLLLNTFNNTTASYPKKKVYQLLTKQAEKTPDAIAVVAAENKLTYAELDRLSDEVAAFLIEKHNIVAGDRVGLLINRSEQMPVMLFGILKSGASYVPIDPQYPAERIQFIIQDSNPKVIISETEWLQYLPEGTPNLLLDKQDFKETSGDKPIVKNRISDVAYIIYTSGSTGVPKGVQITHKNLIAFLYWSTQEFKNADFDTVLAVTSYCFDLSVFEIFYPLTIGKTVQILPSGMALAAHLKTPQKLLVNTVPSLVEGLVKNGEDLSSVTVLNLAGEPIPGRLKQILATGQREVRNLYGPSEATTYSTCYQFKKDGLGIPIGKPILNTQVFILDKQMQIVPIGVPGEICLAGDGVAKGYLGRKALNKTKFIKHPFKNSGRLYRTGDLGRWNKDGVLEYLGRKDNQVKVRGYRIELGEIEAALEQHADVTKASVLVHEKNDTKQIVAFVVGGKTLKDTALQEHLGKLLPSFMQPSYFIHLDAIPLTPNGKTDRKGLLQKLNTTEQTTKKKIYVAPETEIEKALATVWQEVFLQPQIGTQDNFFMIGGDSIKAIQVVSRMHRLGYNLNIRDIFKNPTIASLAPNISLEKKIIDQEPVIGEVAMLPIQKAFFEDKETDRHHYNQAVMIYSEQPLEEEIIRNVIEKIQEHHDALRMTYQFTPQGIIQNSSDIDLPVSLQVFNWKEMEVEEAQRLITEKASEIQSGIDIEKGPLMNLGLFKLADGDRLLIVIHHLAIDGVSWRILFEDIEALYHQSIAKQKLTLPNKTHSYKHWADKLTNWSNSHTFKKESTYWQHIENSPVKPIALDFEVENSTIGDTVALHFELKEEITKALLFEVNDAFNTEVNDILLAALGLTIQKTFNQDLVAIDLEGHGREALFEDVDINRTVGWFTVLYPLLLDMGNANELSQHLKNVKETLRNIPNKGIGYGAWKYLANKTEENQHNKANLKPQILFNYLGQFDEDIQQSSFQIAKEYAGSVQSAAHKQKYLLDFSGMIANKKLRISVNYSQKQFKKETIQLLCNTYQEVLSEIINYCAKSTQTVLTPSDFIFKGLDVATVDKITATYQIEDLYHLSMMQEGLYFQSLYDKGSTAYFNQLAYRLKGNLDPVLVQKSLGLLSGRHQVLRTIFNNEISDRPLQLILKDQKIGFYYEDLTQIADQEGTIKKYKEQDLHSGFDLNKGPLIRMAMLQLSEDTFEFIWSFHHIIMDGWCLNILITEFLAFYKGFLEEKTPTLWPVNPFSDYIQWIEKQDIDSSKQYWADYLSGYTSGTVIPKMKAINIPEVKEEQNIKINLGAKALLLREMASANNATINSLIQAVWSVLLMKYNQNNDILFGTVVAGRPPEIQGIESMIGLFINTIPIRAQGKASMSFKELMLLLQQNSLDSEPHHYCPLSEIKMTAETNQELFDHLVVFENFPIAEQVEGIVEEAGKADDSLQLEILDVDTIGSTHYDFTFVIELGQEMTLKFTYSDAYTTSFVQSLAQHVESIIDQIITNVEVALEDIHLLSENENQLVINQFNNTDIPFSKDKTVVQLFEEQVAKTPDALAIQDHDFTLTYADLNEKANQLANHLKSTYAVKANDFIAVASERSQLWVVSILAVLKAGAAYVPVDPSYPEERINFILEDTHPKVALTSAANKHIISNGIDVLVPEDFLNSEGINKANENLTGHTKVSDSAYVIYTSGTTGKPKGVVVSHQNIVRLAENPDYVQLNQDTRLLPTGSPSFDASTFEVWGTLLNGGKLYLFGQQELLNLEFFKEAVLQNNINTLWLTASWFNQIVDEDLSFFAGLAHVVIGGEKLSPYHVNKLKATYQNLKLVNGYGPTENTTFSLCYEIAEVFTESIPIGKPIGNSKAYILDTQLNPLPVGIAGDLYLGGAGVAKEYLNDEALTKSKFIQSPFIKGDRLYKTGDLAKWLPDGNVEFIGRADSQLKLRGFRIEPQEIANTLKLHPGVEDAFVQLLFEGTKSQALQAIVVPDRNTAASVKHNLTLEQESTNTTIPANAPDTEEVWNTAESLITAIKSFSESQLPPYMIPASFEMIAKFPLTKNGKINAVELKKYGESISGQEHKNQEYKAPTNEIETLLVQIWQDVIGKEQIGILDHFIEVGGHSLKATQVVSRIAREIGVTIEIRTLYEYPTIEKLAEEISKFETNEYKPIEKVPEQPYYKLSHAQRRLWILDQFEESKVAYNVPGAYTLEGQLNIDALERAFTALINRHESLRTVFLLTEDGQPMQKINTVEESNFVLEHLDLSESEGRYQQIQQMAQEEAYKPFDLEKGPLLRAKVVQLEAEAHALLFNMHHIISDGWSMGVLIKEMYVLYQAYNNGEEVLLPELPIQYKDYTYWQDEQISGEGQKEHQDYWWGTFEEEIPLLEFPTDFQRPKNKTYNGRVHTHLLNADLGNELSELARKKEASLFMVLEAMLKVLLYKYTGQQDITLGTSVAGRGHLDLEHQIGFYINTLALRSRFNDQEDFFTLLKTIKNNTLQAYKYQAYPFDKLVEDLDLNRDLSRSPIFDVMIVLQNLDNEQGSTNQAQSELTLGGMGTKAMISQFDMTVIFKETPQGLLMSVEYNTDLYKTARIERFAKHFEQLATTVIEQPTAPLCKITYLLEEEKQQLLETFNTTASSYPNEENIAQLFDKQALLHKSKTAVIDDGNEISYEELHENANKLANYLIKEAGVQKGDYVALLLGRGADYVTGMLGILKAGAVYVPLTADDPEDRINYILEDTRPKVLLTHTDYLFNVTAYQGHIFAFDIQFDDLADNQQVNCSANATDLAYIMYTSGTTGRPKGVAVKQRNVVRLVINTNYVKLEPEDVLLQTGALSFDACTFEFWSMLLNGGTVCMLPHRKLLDKEAMKASIRNNNVTVMWLTSSWFNHLVESDIDLFQGLKQILVGGERLSPRHINKARSAHPTLQLINGYGPTENTTFSICYNISEDWAEDIPLGYPIANSTVYILDTGLNPVPVGIKGEIYLGGDGLAAGYLNQPQLTYQKFVKNPFNPTEYLYKTGDLGIWREDGKVLFAGRADNQIKIQGYRVELQEIAQTIQDYPGIAQAQVLALRNQQGDYALVSFQVPESNQVPEEELRTYLSARLPKYMVPVAFVNLEQMPLTKRGKADQKALKTLWNEEYNEDEKVYEAPANDTEKQLAAIWQEVLSRKQISVSDNFFDLGGHSLRATQVVSRVYKQMGIQIDLGQLFTYPTIRSLAEEIEKKSYAGYQEIPGIEPADFYKVSAGQKRLWMLDQTGNANYNMSGSYEILGELSLPLVESIFKQLIDRHEILRTTFKIHEGEVVQVVHDKLENFKIEYFDWADNPDWENQLTKILEKEAVEGFDLENGPLIRCGLVLLAENKHICLLTMHHIISDGWSIDLMFKELSLLYGAYLSNQEIQLPPLRIQYKDFSAWQQNMLRTDVVSKPKKYWKETFSGELPVITMPFSHPRPEIKTYNGTRIAHFVEASLMNSLHELSKQNGCSLFITLFSAFKVLLYRYTGQQDIIVGTVEAGRQHPDLENQLGFYVNTMAIRTRFDANDTFVELLSKVQQSVLGAYEHMFYPFDAVIDDLDLKWDRSRSPLFDVVLSLVNKDISGVNQQQPTISEEASPNKQNTEVRGYRSEVTSSIFDIVLNVNESKLGLGIDLVYNTDIFEDTQMQLLLQRYIQVLNTITLDTNKKINSFEFDEEDKASHDDNQLNPSLDYDFNF